MTHRVMTPGSWDHTRAIGVVQVLPLVYVSDMDLVAFHRGWFGKNPDHTPKSFQVTPRQTYLYREYPKVKGYSDNRQDVELFIGALVIALAQTDPSAEHEHLVYILTPPVLSPWVDSQTIAIARYLIRSRRTSPKGIELVRKVFHQIVPCGFPHKMPEPARWSSFGFLKEDSLIPPWLAAGLAEVSNVG